VTDATPDEVPVKPTYEAQCYGGPMDGRTVAVRKPSGFVAIDKANVKAWVYDFTPSGFQVRDGGTPQQLDFNKQLDAASSDDFDVVAVP
jgi:hypothetical protein